MKTTLKDFETYKKACFKYQKLLGLMNWRLYFQQEGKNDIYGECHWSMKDSVATMVLTKDWEKARPKTEQEIDALALHECLHLLFAEYASQAEARYTTQDALEIAEHSIIRRLETVILAT